MAHNIPFPPRQPSASTHLPLTLISLEDWALVTLNGPDTVKYLQGQVTADIDALAADQHVLCAHCDAKGKCGATCVCSTVAKASPIWNAAACWTASWRKSKIRGVLQSHHRRR